MPRSCLSALLLLSILTAPLSAADKTDLKTILGRKLLGPDETQREWQSYMDARVPKMPEVRSVAEWEKLAAKIREETLARVVYRGQAAAWRDAKTKVEWLDTVKGGPGYKIKKLRYEALPGLWIPALLYEPDNLSGKVPVILNVNGHDAKGKAAPYKQIRCINLAKRGMLALNVEWLGMGQLRSGGYAHGRMNQIDLCGSSGLAPFYLNMERGLDLLLAHEHADPSRVAVTGLSGGGWQTIYISALDTRVTLSNPVAGYSGYRVRTRHFKDLGDSEQTPNDMATIADYDHFTAMRAPRPTLLTYNAKDDCCFESGYALPPLVQAAAPVYKLYGREDALRSHVNHDPGNHNYEKDNRQAFYRMVGDFFYAGDPHFSSKEIPSEAEVQSAEALNIPLPSPNHDFHTLALKLSKSLPREPDLPTEAASAAAWRDKRLKQLREVIRAKDFTLKPGQPKTEERGGLKVTTWRLKVDDTWTVPVVELVRGTPQGTALLVNDEGKQKAAADAERLLAAGYRVLALDPFYVGEAKIEPRDFLFALMVATVGDRALGIQAGQLAAIARWSKETHGQPVRIVATGVRSDLFALAASALEPAAVGRLELRGSLGSLKEVIEQDRTVNEMAEVFCFGLLEAFDIKQLAALSAPRPVEFVGASARHKKELADLKAWYTLLGTDFEPLR